MKAYIEYNGIKYYDLEVLVDKGNTTGKDYLFDPTTSKKLEYIDSLLDDNFTPVPGEEIHVVPDCPIAIDDIRKSYKIKRTFDSGCCNVFSPVDFSKRYEKYFAYTFAICPTKKKLFLITKYRSDGQYLKALKDFVRGFFIGTPPSDAIYVDCKQMLGIDWMIFNARNTSEAYAKLLKGELTKPNISYKKLQFTNCNELTMDQIDLLYKTARMNNHADIPNFTLQLEALNQCDWREYPRSLTILWGIIQNVPAPVYWFVKDHMSTQKKVVKEILCTPPADKANSKKDYDFAKSIIDHFLGVENVRFTKANTLIKKLGESGISLDVFSEFYDNMIRLTPKEYNEENNDTV